MLRVLTGSSSSSHLGSRDLYLKLLYLFLNFSHTKTLLMCQKILSWPSWKRDGILFFSCYSWSGKQKKFFFPSSLLTWYLIIAILAPPLFFKRIKELMTIHVADRYKTRKQFFRRYFNDPLPSWMAIIYPLRASKKKDPSVVWTDMLANCDVPLQLLLYYTSL